MLSRLPRRENDFRMRALTLLLIIAIAAASPRVEAAAEARAAIGDFFGDYRGRTLFPMGEVKNRDLRVLINAYGKFGGFTLLWETTIYEAGGKARLDRHLYNFRPSRNPGVYAVARTDADGNRVVADPLSGEPLVWARIQGDTLSVTLVSVAASGDLETQIYDRTLTDEGLRLLFRRFVNGEKVRQIKGTLKQIAE